MQAKLQKQLAYKYNDKKHYKHEHVVVVPDEAIIELGWKGGQELELTVENGRLILEMKLEEETV